MLQSSLVCPIYAEILVQGVTFVRGKVSFHKHCMHTLTHDCAAEQHLHSLSLPLMGTELLASQQSDSLELDSAKLD